MEIIHGQLGSLSEISDLLHEQMQREIKRNGYSDLTLYLEGACHGIREIIEMNYIKEVRKHV